MAIELGRWFTRIEVRERPYTLAIELSGEKAWWMVCQRTSVAELVDVLRLGRSASRLAGSSPAACIQQTDTSLS
jgi:hypothetical protein